MSTAVEAKMCSFSGCVSQVFNGSLCPAHHKQRGKGEDLRPLQTYNRLIGDYKACASCRVVKHRGEFHISSHSSTGLDSYCKSCKSEKKKSAYDPRKQRNASLLRKFGITLEQYESRLAKQGGHCALCPRTEEDEGKALAVDHIHSCCPGKKTCGKCIRGLLCTNCNQGIGKLQDSPNILRRAAAYLESFIPKIAS